MNEQARRDAIADAETLRLVVRPRLPWTHLERARIDGAACLKIAAGPSVPVREVAAFAADTARLAARAAFRAVPSLKSDDAVSRVLAAYSATGCPARGYGENEG